MTAQAFAAEIRLWVLPSRTLPRRLWPVIAGMGYIALIALLGGLRWDHWVMGGLLALDAYNERTRRFLWFFLPFILTGMVYDSLRYYYWIGIESHIHVSEPYYLERRLFGIRAGGGVETLNEFFATHHWPALDILCGCAYLTFVNESLFTGLILFFVGRLRLAFLLSWSFFVVNVLGYATYFIYPAAPPWYVAQYGLGPPRLDIHPNPAAGHRFDQLLGTRLFDDMYGKGIDVFGAYPSLHVAYPLIVAVVLWRLGRFRPLAVIAFLYWGLMCFSAIYLQHHYLVDVLMGITYALGTLWAMDKALRLPGFASLWESRSTARPAG